MDKILTDFHMHSALSGDACSAQEEYILNAIGKGCKYIALTEHCNLDFVKYGYKEILTTDLELYDREYKSLKKKFAGRIEITYGIELGWDESLDSQYADIIKKYGYDYVINSIHIINGADCYWERYFARRTQKEGYEAYLNAVYESLFATYRFDTVGHFGYITRNSPFENRDMLTDYRDTVEAILKKMIEKGVALELNSSVRTAPAPCLPQKEIIELYKELGGEFVVYGSDAHSPESVCRSRDAVMKLLKDCGFKYHTVFIGKERKMLPVI